MARLITEDYFKARIDDLLFYRYRNMMVVRTISGFTKETRTTAKKYDNCTRSAMEFGRVSALCKLLRVALNGILPKQNNLAVVNSLTKKMREALHSAPCRPSDSRSTIGSLEVHALSGPRCRKSHSTDTTQRTAGSSE